VYQARLASLQRLNKVRVSLSLYVCLCVCV
jgi:hypothetical protein